MSYRSSAMSAHVCPNCGAPLPIAAPGAVEHCEFCGAETREDGPTQSAGSRDGLPSTMGIRAAKARSPGCGVLLLGIGVPLAIALVTWLVLHVSAGKSGSPLSTRLTLASLATTPLGGGSRSLDAPGMIGNYESFDAVANLDWARTIGTSWKADAILTRVVVDRVAKDGTVNLAVTPKAEVRYDFVSPKCIADYKSSTSLVDPQTTCELIVELQAYTGGPGVTVAASSASTDLPYDELRGVTCTAEKAFAVLEKAGNLPARPVYDATLEESSGPRPIWSFHTVIPGQAQIHTIDAATCAVAW